MYVSIIYSYPAKQTENCDAKDLLYDGSIHTSIKYLKIYIVVYNIHNNKGNLRHKEVNGVSRICVKGYVPETNSPPSTTKVLHVYANSLDPDETPSNSASHPNPSCLTPRQHFHQL